MIMHAQYFLLRTVLSILTHLIYFVNLIHLLEFPCCLSSLADSLIHFYLPRWTNLLHFPPRLVPCAKTIVIEDIQ